MKHGKLCLAILLALVLSLTVIGCKSDDCTYTAWEMTVVPTIETEGSAQRYCEGCHEYQTVTLPALSDETFWTKNVTDATHFAEGKIVYSCEYATVEESIAIIPHAHGDWEIVTAPTLDNGGTAQKVCECGDVISTDVPALTDTSVWTVEHEAEATHFVAGLDVYTSIYGTVEVVLPVIAHSYGAWTITSEPTLDAAGKASHACSCEHVEEIEIPALTDTSVWAVEHEAEATHFVAGKDVYTSIYGTVEVVLPVIAHVYGDWAITSEPTLDVAGKASRACSCEHVEEIDLPVLTDTSVWAVEHVSVADYNASGLDKYTSIYGAVEVATAKLVAPYDGMTYLPIALDSNDYENRVVKAETTWSRAFTLDSLGKGFGYMHMFRAYNEFSMVNASTGEIAIKAADVIETDGVYSIDPEGDINNYVGYVDFATGIAVIKCSSSALYGYVFVLVPNQTDAANVQIVASAWDNAMAIDYVNGDVTHSIFVYNEVVNFGVSFEDMAGNKGPANQCYNNDYVYVKKAGNLLARFAFNGEGMVVTDGLEGTYASETDELVLSGFGTALLNGEQATYVVVDGVIGVYTADAYYVASIDGNSVSIVKPMVQITFDAGDKATVEGASYNVNVACELPVPENEDYSFKGWYYDSACTNAVASPFIPTESVTLYANWKAKVVINILGALDGDATQIKLGAGDVIGEYLPVYGLEVEEMLIFRGWYLDADYSVSLPESAEVTEEDNNITVYAKWDALPAYYGTYYGTELYNAGYGNYGKKTLTIDENGNMSGLKTGIIQSYDPETQIITWKASATDTKINSFSFDANTGVIAGIYNSTEIGNDFYFLSKYEDSTGVVNAYYGIKAAKSPENSLRGWYAHFVNAETALGTIELFIYNNRIYSDFTATDAAGNAITAANVKNSKVAIVKDANGNIIISVASTGASFSANSNTVDLDEYFGTYVNGSDTAVLDGVGTITYNGVAGTYEKAPEGAGYGFDVYLADGAEYYHLTLNGASFDMAMPIATLTYEEGAYASIEDVSINLNVAYVLPSLEHETNVFNGWFYDEACTMPVGESIIITEDTTIYALWKVKVILTVNTDEESYEVEYSEGDTATVANPVKAGHYLLGWYTTQDFVEGTEWAADCDTASGSVSAVITENVSIYAKWAVSPIYSNTYASMEFDGTNANGSGSGAYTRNAVITVDGYGNGPKGTSWPFASGTVAVKNYDEATGYIEFHVGSSFYRGYIDAETRFVVLSDTSGASGDFDEIMVLNPVDAKNAYDMWSHSYWRSGDARAISYLPTNYNIFILDDVIYFGVSFATMEGASLVGNECYSASSVIVTDANGNIIAKFGHDGTTLQLMDGNEGTYTSGSDTLVIDGVKTAILNGVAGTYTAAAEGSAYGFDVYVDGCYYEATLNKADYTFSINKPMVTIDFVTYDLAEVASLTVNKNIAIELPVPSCETHVFRSWYFDEDYSLEVPADFVPTESIQIYAKWAQKIILTVVYGNGLENATAEYAAGDTITLVVPGATNGLYFEGWYADADFTTAFTATTISESTTVYCNWTDAVPFTATQYNGTYKMVYDAAAGTWTSSNNGKSSSSCGIEIVAGAVDIEVSFSYVVSSESGWDKLYIYHNGGQPSGAPFSGEKSGTITVTVRAGNNIRIYYQKDGSGDKGSDRIVISNLTVAGAAVTEVADKQ